MKIIIYSILILHLLEDKRMVRYDIIPDLIIISNSLIVGKMAMVAILDMVASSDCYHFGKQSAPKIIAYNFGPCQGFYLFIFCIWAKKQRFFVLQ